MHSFYLVRTVNVLCVVFRVDLFRFFVCLFVAAVMRSGLLTRSLTAVCAIKFSI